MFLATAGCLKRIVLEQADAFPQVFGYIQKVEVLLQFFHSRSPGAEQLDPLRFSGQSIEAVDDFRVWEITCDGGFIADYKYQ